MALVSPCCVCCRVTIAPVFSATQGDLTRTPADMLSPSSFFSLQLLLLLFEQEDTSPSSRKGGSGMRRVTSEASVSSMDRADRKVNRLTSSAFAHCWLIRTLIATRARSLLVQTTGSRLLTLELVEAMRFLSQLCELERFAVAGRVDVKRSRHQQQQQQRRPQPKRPRSATIDRLCQVRV